MILSLAFSVARNKLKMLRGVDLEGFVRAYFLIAWLVVTLTYSLKLGYILENLKVIEDYCNVTFNVDILHWTLVKFCNVSYYNIYTLTCNRSISF